MYVAYLRQSELVLCSSRTCHQIQRCACVRRSFFNDIYQYRISRILTVYSGQLFGVLDSVLAFHGGKKRCMILFCIFFVLTERRNFMEQTWSTNFVYMLITFQAKKVMYSHVQLVAVVRWAFTYLIILPSMQIFRMQDFVIRNIWKAWNKTVSQNDTV